MSSLIQEQMLNNLDMFEEFLPDYPDSIDLVEITDAHTLDETRIAVYGRVFIVPEEARAFKGMQACMKDNVMCINGYRTKEVIL